MLKDCVITGTGVTSSIGVGKQLFWTSLLEGRSHFVPNFIYENNKTISPKVGKVVLPPESSSFLSPRIQRKIDRFTILALIAQEEASRETNLKKAYSNLDRIGIIISNAFGGWEFVESQLHDLYHVSYDTLNPYVATAWFPTAPQGEISILQGIKGYSKTIAADYLGIAYCIIHALDLMNNDVLEGCFVGGVEAPLTALVFNVCERSNLLSKQENPLPFHSQSDGYFLSEGSAILFFEKEKNAISRSAKILGRVGGICIGKSYKETMKNCMEDAKVSPRSIGGILLDAKGYPEKDIEEFSAIKNLFAPFNQEIFLTAPKAFYGNVFSADLGLQIISALMILRTGIIPHTPVGDYGFIQPSYGTYVKAKPLAYPVENILINGSDLHGQYVSLLIKK